MTNHWIDVRNADVILVMGANPAENHPLAMRWIAEARERGAKVLSVDPRFTRTSAQADLYAPLRPGTDIAFLGGLIRLVLERRLYHEEYLRLHTDASFLVDSRFGFEDGLFTGYDAGRRRYDRSTWRYEIDERGLPREDPTLKDPRCVLQVLRRHFESYDPETVSRVTGTPAEDLVKVWDAFGSTGAPDRVGTLLYAMGWTQSTHGTQNIRAAAILQLLLGNVGRAGGGVNALRGESNVQGSTDHALLFDLLPGYLKAPRAGHRTLAEYLRACTPPPAVDRRSVNAWSRTPAFAVSWMRWMYGTRASAEEEFGYGLLPKMDDDFDGSWLSLFRSMEAGGIRGLFAWGQNPAVGGADALQVRRALGKLDWLVSVNLWDTETASFWSRPGSDPSAIPTEVFHLPCAASVEKEGSVTNSGRWAQWRGRAADPPGEARPDSWILNQLMIRLRRLYAAEPGPDPRPILDLDWDYGEGEVDPHRVAREVNGLAVADLRDAGGKVIARAGEPLADAAQLRDDGSTACGNWLYCGSYTGAGNQMARRDAADLHPAGIGLHAGWAWAWPANRRILYNRAGCDASGRPFDPKRFAVRWTPAAGGGPGGAWEGDVPDGAAPPGTKHAFVMLPEGRARIFGAGRVDGPLPVHYEPWESPVPNLLHRQQVNPALRLPEAGALPPGDRGKFPVVATTFRVSEHWQSGAMTRNNAWLAEAQPEMFVEMGPELAASRGIEGGDLVVVESARGSIEAVAVVTRRLAALRLGDRVVHQVGLPWHWGYRGLVTGSSANVLTPGVGDANTMIPETKAFLCEVRRAAGGRRG